MAPPVETARDTLDECPRRVHLRVRTLRFGVNTRNRNSHGYCCALGLAERCDPQCKLAARFVKKISCAARPQGRRAACC